MSTPVEEAWSPEPELREPAPRRLQPSEYGDLNVPNVAVYTAVGGVLLLVGIALFVYGLTGATALVALGILVALAGGFALTFAPRKAAQAKARAERLVRDGQPIMARIVNTSNLTGDSTHGRSVSYMVSLPGSETPIRRDVNADERALPKRIPGNVTALIDPANTSDVELYCALPFRAVARPVPAAADPLADLPTVKPAEGGTMRPLDPQGAAEPAQTQTQTQQVQPQPKKSDYQGLPWE